MKKVTESNFKTIMENSILLENFISELNLEVYPITLAKFIICKDWIETCFTKENRIKYKVDNSDCPVCKLSNNTLCRQHRSIQRVLSASSVVYINDMDCYIYKNEIFKRLNNSLIIIYCSHTKLIKDNFTEIKIKKLLPITVVDEKDEDILFPKIINKIEMNSNDFINKRFSCWFNKDFSIIMEPNMINNEYNVPWYLIPNN